MSIRFDFLSVQARFLCMSHTVVCWVQISGCHVKQWTSVKQTRDHDFGIKVKNVERMEMSIHVPRSTSATVHGVA